MAYEVIWSHEAASDVSEIAEYIAKHSENYAASMVQKFEAAAEGLSQFPRMGRMLPELERADYRDWIVGPYRLVYRVDEAHERLTIVAVVHGARLLMSAIQERLPKRRKKPDSD